MKNCKYCGSRVHYWSAHYYCPETYRVLRGFIWKGETKKEKPTIHRWKTYKKGKGGYWYGSSWKKNWKTATKRKHRAWQREMINKERFDEFHNRSYKNAEDPWAWD